MIKYNQLYESKFRPQIAVDFDNTIAYHDATIPFSKTGKPLDGAIDFIKELHRQGWEIWIFSARCYNETGTKAIQEWIEYHSLTKFIAGITNVKSPDFIVMVDDRAIEFTGSYSEVLDKLQEWK